jgi:hypothetical protein
MQNPTSILLPFFKVAKQKNSVPKIPKSPNPSSEGEEGRFELVGWFSFR